MRLTSCEAPLPSSEDPADHLPSPLPLLARRPRELADIFLKDLERHLDPLWARPPAYDAFTPDAGRAALARALPETVCAWNDEALRDIEALVTAKQSELRGTGPWGGHYDADMTLGRYLYVLCRALRPSLVVETGVAYGLSSAFILQALHANGHGHLESIDLAPRLPARGNGSEYVGALIPPALTARWHLHRGSSRRLLRGVLAGHTVDLFVQDSSHTYLTVRRECAAAWRQLRPGGVLVSDDIECSQAFNELHARQPAFWGCFTQQSKRALFGIAVK